MSKKQVIPLGEYVLLSRMQEPKQEGMLFRVDTQEENVGTVLAVGDNVNTDEQSTKLEVGDRVIYIKGTGTGVTNSSDSDLLIRVNNIIGKYKESK